MYPCFDASVTYGLAVTGLDINGTIPVTLETDGAVSEPDVRMGASPSHLTGKVTARGLTVGAKYALYRYASTASLPAAAPFTGYEKRVPFTAARDSFTYVDPDSFPSNTAVYYFAAAEA